MLPKSDVWLLRLSNLEISLPRPQPPTNPAFNGKSRFLMKNHVFLPSKHAVLKHTPLEKTSKCTTPIPYQKWPSRSILSRLGPPKLPLFGCFGPPGGVSGGLAPLTRAWSPLCLGSPGLGPLRAGTLPNGAQKGAHSGPKWGPKGPKKGRFWAKIRRHPWAFFAFGEKG